MTLVIVHHGTPASSLVHPWWVEDAEKRGIQLVGYQRAGYADTPREPGREVAGVARGVARVSEVHEWLLERL